MSLEELKQTFAAAQTSNNADVRNEMKVNAVVQYLVERDGTPCVLCGGEGAILAGDGSEPCPECQGGQKPSVDLEATVRGVLERVNAIEAADVADAFNLVEAVEVLIAKIAKIERFLDDWGFAPAYEGTFTESPDSASESDSEADGANPSPAAPSASSETTANGDGGEAESPASTSSEYLCCLDDCPQAERGYGLVSWDELGEHAQRAHGAQLEAVDGGYVYRVAAESVPSGAAPADVLPARWQLERMNNEALKALAKRHGVLVPDEPKRAIIDALTGSKEPVNV
jgi:hypothetical protein